MNDKCSAKKAAIPNFFPTIFITTLIPQHYYKIFFLST